MDVVVAMVAFRILTASETFWATRVCTAEALSGKEGEVTKCGVGNVWAKDSCWWYGSDWDHKSDNDTETEDENEMWKKSLLAANEGLIEERSENPTY